jgi:hypothetical protein
MEALVNGICSEDFVERVRLNQSKLSSEMKSQYDFIICGSGSSGSVVARPAVVPILPWLPVSNRPPLLINAHQLGICGRSLN